MMPSWLWHDEVRALVPEASVAASATLRTVLDAVESIERHIAGCRSRIVFWFDN